MALSASQDIHKLQVWHCLPHRIYTNYKWGTVRLTFWHTKSCSKYIFYSLNWQANAQQLKIITISYYGTLFLLKGTPIFCHRLYGLKRLNETILYDTGGTWLFSQFCSNTATSTIFLPQIIWTEKLNQTVFYNARGTWLISQFCLNLFICNN